MRGNDDVDVEDDAEDYGDDDDDRTTDDVDICTKRSKGRQKQ